MSYSCGDLGFDHNGYSIALDESTLKSKCRENHVKDTVGSGHLSKDVVSIDWKNNWQDRR